MLPLQEQWKNQIQASLLASGNFLACGHITPVGTWCSPCVHLPSGFEVKTELIKFSPKPIQAGPLDSLVNKSHYFHS